LLENIAQTLGEGRSALLSSLSKASNMGASVWGHGTAIKADPYRSHSRNPSWMSLQANNIEDQARDCLGRCVTQISVRLEFCKDDASQTIVPGQMIKQDRRLNEGQAAGFYRANTRRYGRIHTVAIQRDNPPSGQV
jgi:hypothetical protein